MYRHLTAAALAAAALLLTGCVSTAPSYRPPTAVEQPAPAAPASDEDAFVDALHAGTVIPGLIDTNADLRAATIDAGWSVCALLDSAATPDEGMRAALVNAEQYLDDRTLFTDAMPSLFVASAAVHLCGVRA